ncbi:MAG: SCP2 sterol-binding domain-containing protein [Bacillota bacterium]|nr:SCP2 sterol-binding domain-containing protein [Bacillota bacterium]
MVGADEMGRILEAFVDRFNANPQLAQMAAGWERTILIRAKDAGWRLGLEVSGGRVRFLDDGALPASAQIVLESESETLAAIFRGELSPTDPYLDGSLVVRSSEADMMKLDVFTLMVWGE